MKNEINESLTDDITVEEIKKDGLTDVISVEENKNNCSSNEEENNKNPLDGVFVEWDEYVKHDPHYIKEFKEYDEKRKKELINNPELLFNLPVEKQIEEIKYYNLENIPVFNKRLFICENLLKLNHINNLTVGLNEIKETFTDILKIDKDDREDVINNLPKSYQTNDNKEYVNLLKEIVLNDDNGLQKIDENGISYYYFMNIENCRKYIFEQGFIQLYSHTGLYHTISKCKFDYKKSKDFLKRIKIFEIKQIKDKETYSFTGLEKLFFIDKHNKNYKLTWNPNKNKTYTENGINFYNEYSPIRYQGINHQKDLSLIYYHIKHFLCGDNEKVYNYFISVISDMIKNPGRKLPVCVVMNGDGGVGKSFLFDKLFSKLFGEMYGSISNKFPSRFNSIIENKICFLFEEFSHQDNITESNLMKNYISNPELLIERKGMEQHYSPNCIRFFICSNGDWSVRIENNNSSRRYLVCDVSEEIPDGQHFENLSLLIKGDKRRGFEDETVLRETIEQFIFDMNLIDTSVLENDPPMTESKKISQSYSKGIQDRQLEGFFEKIIFNDGYYNFEFPSDKFYKIIDKDNDQEVVSFEFWDCFNDYLKNQKQQIPTSTTSYGRILSKWFGKDCSKISKRLVDGRRTRIYTFPKMETVELLFNNM